MTRLAIVGGGWAGLATAVAAVDRGCHVTLIEMAPQPGGRARGVVTDGRALDNGQHILIGAYTETLALMRRVGVQTGLVLTRSPLALTYPDGSGLRLREGAPMPAFTRAVLGAAGWRWGERLALLGAAARWALAGFRADDATTVAQLAQALPARVREDVIEPLCVAALNTPADRASARVFLRVLHDALFAGRGGADLLLPRRTLSDLLPDPAWAWLTRAGAELRQAQRVQTLQRQADGWHVDGERFDAVVLACSASEAARLAQPSAPDWSAITGAFCYEPIVTVWLRSPGSRLPLPMVALRAGPDAPAQFAFDLGQLGGPSDALAGVFTFVVSGARGWLDAVGLDGVAAAVQRQAVSAFGPTTWRTAPSVLHRAADKRATFACTPGLKRPPASIATGLAAAGDYVAGPYPATLEGAVRSAAPALDAALAGL